MKKSVFAYVLAFLALGGVGAVVACTATISTNGDTCATDTTVTCTDGTGYSCTGSDTPDQDDSTLVCSYPVQGNAGSTTFCCFQQASGTTATTCGVDSTVTGCVPGSFGFSCSNANEDPQSAYPQLVCSDAQAGNGGSAIYCCTDGSSTTQEDSGITTSNGSCVMDTSVGCDAATGYSCTGGAFPQTANTGLSCSQAFVDDAGGIAEFCCTGT